MRRSTEIISAGCVAMFGMVLGMVGPAGSSEPGWDPQAAVLASFQDAPTAEVSDSTARTATAILSVRDAFGSDFNARSTRFTIADPPGPAELVIEGGSAEEAAFQRPVQTASESRITTSVRVAAPVQSEDSDTVVTPYAGLAVTPEGTEARVGAKLRIGDGQGPQSRWILFAAAERQRLIYDTQNMTRPLQAIDITPYTSIGDAQAGIAYRLNAQSDVALAYVRRDWAYRYGPDEWEEAEEFAAVSFVARW